MKSLGKYRLLEHLASGGMAEVWRAEMPGPEGFVKEVALKLIRGEHRGDDTFSRMFAQEARLASRLSHANVVHVFDFDVIDGRYVLAMELVRGETLRAVLDRCRAQGVRFGLARALHVAAEVARGLAYAHRLEDGGRPAGLVHRDVSPQNVLVSFEGEVKLADFGIARAEGALEQTRPGTVKGKIAYMAPEQARGEPVDARADVFALGVVLWEMCTGRRLFARDSDAATLAALIGGDPISAPSAWNEQVPPDLDALVLRAVERDPARRLSNADELATALAALRLRLARDPDDLDLRGFMRRLWPAGAARKLREPTQVREAAPALPSVTVAAERADASAGADDPTLARPVPPAEELSTRTFATPSARRGRRVVLLALAAGLATTAGVLALARRAPPPPPQSSRAPPADGAAESPPAAEPSPASAAVAPPATPQAAAAPARPRSSGDAAAEPRDAAPASATLGVNAYPWATVTVDGRSHGDTPVTLELPPGRHRVRATRPGGATIEEELDLAPGEHREWRARFPR